MKNFNYYLIRSLWNFGALLPFKVLYFFSDIIYLLVYYVVRYRRKVVRKNLVNSFPEKTIKEIVQIEKKFYAWFCDFIVEIIKIMTHFITCYKMAEGIEYKNNKKTSV